MDVGEGRMCWRGKKETRPRKSEKSVGEVLKPLKQNVQKCALSKFLIQIRKYSVKAGGARALTGRDPTLISCPHRETCYNRANIVHLQLVCMRVRARQRECERERKQMGGVYWLHIVYSLSTG